MKKIVEALKATAIIMAVSIAVHSAIWYLSYFLLDHFGLVADIIFWAVVLFGCTFLAVWALSKDRKDGDKG